MFTDIEVSALKARVNKLEEHVALMTNILLTCRSDGGSLLSRSNRKLLDESLLNLQQR